MKAAWKLLNDFCFVTYHLLHMLRTICPGHMYVLLALVVCQASLPYVRWHWFGQLIDQPTVRPLLFFSSLLVLGLIVDQLVKKIIYSVDQYFYEAFAPFLPQARQRYGMSSFQRGSVVYNSLHEAERASYSAAFLVQGQFLLIGRLLTLIVGVATLLWFAPIVGLVVAAAAAVIVAVEVYCAVRLARHERSLWSDKAEVTSLKNLFTYNEKMKCLLLFGIDDQLICRITAVSRRLARSLLAVSRRTLAPELFSAVTLGLAFAAGLWMMLDGFQAGQFSRGEMAFLITTVITVGVGMKGIVETVAQQALGADKLVDLFRFMFTQPKPSAASLAGGSLQDMPAYALPEVEVVDLTFEYEQGKPVLRNVSAEFPAGKTTYLVGANGAGKTTLLNVLSKLYPVPEGKIFLGKFDVAHVSTIAWQSRVRHMGQDSLSLKLTPYELLAMAAGLSVQQVPSDERQIDPPWREKMWQALELACLADKVRGFKRGLLETFAVWREAEEDLSGGQWRKLNVAMTFMGILSGRVSVVILDEPFHGIEPRHARQILENFQKLPVTLILVSHHADMMPANGHVVFMHRTGHGESLKTVVYSGTHAELLRQYPEYVEYCALDPLWQEMLLAQQPVAKSA